MLVVKNPPTSAGDVRDASSMPGLRRSPRRGHSNPLQFLTWRIPRTEDPGGLQSIWLERVAHDWGDLANMHARESKINIFLRIKQNWVSSTYYAQISMCILQYLDVQRNRKQWSIVKKKKPIISIFVHLSKISRDFCGSPVVKTSPSRAGGASSIPGQEVKIPHASGPQNQKH